MNSKNTQDENLIKSIFFQVLLKLMDNDKKIQYGEYFFKGEISKTRYSKN